MTSLEISILKSFKNTEKEQIIDSALVWEAAIKLVDKGLLRHPSSNDGMFWMCKRRIRFSLTEKGKEVCDKWRGEQ